MSRSAKTLGWLAFLAFPAVAGAAEGAPVQQVAAQAPAQVQPVQIQPAPAASTAPAEKAEAASQNSAVYGLLRDIENLKAEISRLRGQNEMFEYRLESLGKRQSDLYLDLDKRLEDLRKQAREAPPAQAAGATPAKDDPLAETKAYEDALEQFKAGNYDKAITGFSSFLKTYPRSTLAANAQYWTGYAYYVQKDYKNAIEQQTKLLSAYPQSPKVPDAMLNMASSQMEMKDTDIARKNFQEIIAKYPGSNAAVIAAKRLELLK